MPNVQPSNYGYCQTQSRFIQVLDMGFLESDPPSSAYPEGCSGWSTCNHYFGDGEALLSAVNLAKHSHTTERRSGQPASYSSRLDVLSNQGGNSFTPTHGQPSVQYSVLSPNSRLNGNYLCTKLLQRAI